jgi:hypothetical protein
VAPFMGVGMVVAAPACLPVFGDAFQPAAQPGLQRIHGLGSGRFLDVGANQTPVDVMVRLGDDGALPCGVAVPGHLHPGEQDRLMNLPSSTLTFWRV